MLEALAIAAVMYTVKPGDTLYAVSPNHDWEATCAENHIQDCNLIYPGERIVLSGGTAHTDAVVRPSEPRQSVILTPTVESGTLGCQGLENLWEAAGGNSGSAFIAAEIAMAESGGNQYATGPYGEEGYWQINPVNVGLATYDAYGNARSAIELSGNGSNWSPWTTYETGAYIGRC